MRTHLAILALTTLTALPAAAQSINQDLKLTASDDMYHDLFGSSVSISGATAIIGAFGTEAAYLFDTTTGKQLFKLTAPDTIPGDSFGSSVAISGTTAIVGAHRDDNEFRGTGSAYIFDTTTGKQLFKILASDAASGDGFGRVVAISGTTAIVAASGNDAPVINSGAAYIFDTTTGEQRFKLNASDAEANDQFGSSVAISGDTAIVGAWIEDDAGTNSGAAYIFDTTTGEQRFKLTASDAVAGEYFGSSVAISGNIAIVGARRDDDAGPDSGSAYIFDTTTGEQLFKLTASDPAENEQFAYSVAISGTTAIVGARRDGDAGLFSGSAYLFDAMTGEQRFKLTASDAAAGDEFGISVAISGTTSIVGASFDDDAGPSSGSAYIFNLPTCPTDLDNSGATDLTDLNTLLAAFNNSPAGDTNNDGTTDLADLNALLAAFGTPCP